MDETLLWAESSRKVEFFTEMIFQGGGFFIKKDPRKDKTEISTDITLYDGSKKIGT